MHRTLSRPNFISHSVALRDMTEEEDEETEEAELEEELTLLEEDSELAALDEELELLEDASCANAGSTLSAKAPERTAERIFCIRKDREMTEIVY